jgi:hypothetical protein
VGDLIEGYAGLFDEYLNDMDGRGITDAWPRVHILEG